MRASLKTVIVYAIFAALWLSIPERLWMQILPSFLADSPGARSLTSNVLFVLVSAILLFVLLERALRPSAPSPMPTAAQAGEPALPGQPDSERIAFLAAHDPLTRLPNAALLRDRIEQALYSLRRTQRGVAVLMLDLDRFVSVNDTYGTAAGDQVLQELARRLQAAIRSGDTVARVGGDEFAVGLCDLRSNSDIAFVMERIAESTREIFRVDGRETVISLSGGIAVYPEDGADADSLLRHASAALHRAKEKPGTYAYYAPSMSEDSRERVELHRELRQALDRSEFELHYQPQIDARSGRIVGCEALIRWRRPGAELVAASHFIPLAEDTGLVVPIGDWALTEACRQCMVWNRSTPGPLTVSVNVSRRQFHRGTLIFQIQSALEQSSLDPALLEIEFKEGAVPENREETLKSMRDLKQLGVRLALDDFGQANSSLGYLKRFGTDRLKIDPSFVQNIETDPGDATIAQSIVTLGHSLKMEVIAEGVETAGQARLLSDWGCDQLQGYFFGRPVGVEAFTALLAERKQFEWKA